MYRNQFIFRVYLAYITTRYTYIMYMKEQTEVLNLSQILSAKLVLAHHNKAYQYHEQRDILGITISRSKWTYHRFLEYPTTIEIMAADPNVTVRHLENGETEIWNDAAIHMTFSNDIRKTTWYPSNQEAIAAFDELCSKMNYVKISG